MYTVNFLRKASKTLKKIDKVYSVLILNKLNELAKNPFENTNVKALAGKNKTYRLRVADYRVIYEIKNNELIILVLDIDHRSRIYKNI